MDQREKDLRQLARAFENYGQALSKPKENNVNRNAISSGMGFGTLVAALISWKLYGSVGWVILHGLLGWAYVLYWAIFIGHL